MLGDDACNDIARAAWRERNDECDRPRRIGLRPRKARHRWERRNTSCQMQKSTAGKFQHGVAPLFQLKDKSRTCREVMEYACAASLALDVRCLDDGPPSLDFSLLIRAEGFRRLL